MWYYRVRALTDECVGGWSNVQSVRVWSIPDRPDLYEIDNSDGDGDYDVYWSTVDDAQYYELEEADNSSFQNATLA